VWHICILRAISLKASETLEGGDSKITYLIDSGVQLLYVHFVHAGVETKECILHGNHIELNLRNQGGKRPDGRGEMERAVF